MRRKVDVQDATEDCGLEQLLEALAADFGLLPGVTPDEEPVAPDEHAIALGVRQENSFQLREMIGHTGKAERCYRTTQ